VFIRGYNFFRVLSVALAEQRMAFGSYLAALTFLVPFPGWQAADPEPPWHTDHAKALAEARHTGKPIFAVFT
jgi:hypothetical protein